MEIPSKLEPDKLTHKNGNDYVCNQCSKVLVRIQPNGILGNELNDLDLVVITDHYLAKHKLSTWVPK